MENTEAFEMIRAMKKYADTESFSETEGRFKARNNKKFSYKIKLVRK